MKKRLLIIRISLLFGIAWILAFYFLSKSSDPHSLERFIFYCSGALPLILGGIIDLFKPKLGIEISRAFFSKRNHEPSLKLVRFTGFILCTLAYTNIRNAYLYYLHFTIG